MIRKWRLGLLLAVLIAAAAGGVVGWRRWREDTRDAVHFKKTLGEVLTGADEVRVTEHSDEADFLSSSEAWSGPLPAFEYQAVTLSGAQRGLLLEETRRMSDMNVRWMAACTPEIHHTFRFIQKSGAVTTMEVCFQCGQVVWEGEVILEPEDGIDRLSSFVSKIGMHPRQDWAKLGKERLKDLPDAPHVISPPPAEAR